MSYDNSFCAKCGAPLEAGSSFCPSCGAAIPRVAPGPSAPTPQQPQPMDWREQRRQWRAQRRAERNEKYEKGEKGRRGNIVGPLIGGLILIWLGITFYLQQINYISSGTWWGYFVAGIGVILIAMGLLNYSRYHAPLVGYFIGGAILLLIGLSNIATVEASIWPLILVVIGAAILVSAFVGRGRRPYPNSSPPS